MNEIKLIKECQNGNESSFNELITIYYPFIYKFILKMVSNIEASKDLTQDVFLKLIRNIDKFDLKRKEKFSTYLITIAKNTCLDYFKINKKEIYNVDIELISNTNINYEKLSNDNIDIILQEIEKLPKEQRLAIKLKYLEDYTIEEIAKTLKEKPQTIKSRLYEARCKLKNKLLRRNDLWD